jgi:hypothetical protein
VAESDRAWRLVRSYRVEGEHDLAATLLPPAMLGHAVFANVKCVENGRPVRRQVEGEDPLGCVRRRRVPLVSARKVSPLAPNKAGVRLSRWVRQLCPDARGHEQPTKSHQGNQNLSWDTEGS